MSTPRFSSVQDYLASLDETKAATVRVIFDLILTEFPDLESKISWNVPMIHRGGKYVAGISAHKNHLTFAPWSVQVMEDFQVRLKDFVVLKNCFHIAVDWKVDKKLIKDLVRARLAELGVGGLHTIQPARWS